MSGAGSAVRSIINWLLLATATALLVLGLQWRAPERTVEPIADRFLCSGQVVVDPLGGSDSNIVREITCLDGREVDDLTGLTNLALAVPVASVIATFAVLFRRFLTPRPGVRIRRAST
jgi:hypothetical protein